MVNILITTIYGSTDPILLLSTKFSIDMIYVVIDKEENKRQMEVYEKLKDTIGNIIEIKPIKTELYDIVKVAQDITKVIDMVSEKENISINITGSRRTQALGLLYAAYARAQRISKILYVVPEEKKVVYLPKLDYNLNNSQKSILETIQRHKFKSHSDLAEKMNLSRGMVYRTITELINLGLLIQDEEEGFRLTDAGKIVVL